MNKAATPGRPNQKQRTRKALLQAAATLMKQGRKPTLEEIAEEALVSRATAYRYFPSMDALHLEASFDIDTPQADDVLRGASGHDVVARLERVDDALHAMTVANEAQVRMMLAQSLQRSVQSDAAASWPLRQNRRTPLIEAALEPARGRVNPAALKNLARALALVVGTEAMVVLKDVLRLDDTEARKVRRWAIRALTEAAIPSRQTKLPTR